MILNVLKSNPKKKKKFLQGYYAKTKKKMTKQKVIKRKKSDKLKSVLSIIFLQ